MVAMVAMLSMILVRAGLQEYKKRLMLTHQRYLDFPLHALWHASIDGLEGEMTPAISPVTCPGCVVGRVPRCGCFPFHVSTLEKRNNLGKRIHTVARAGSIGTLLARFSKTQTAKTWEPGLNPAT